MLYPAVSGVHVFGGPSIGANQDTLFGGADANISIPFGQRFGAQFGGTPNFFSGRFNGSAEAHVFARDPTIGMIGLYGSYTGWSGWGGSSIPFAYTDVNDLRSNFFRTGIQAEYYGARWTLGAVLGWKSSGQTRAFFDTRLSYYLGDYTKLYVGYEFTDRWLADQRFYLLDTNGALVNSGIVRSPNLSIAKFGGEQILPFDISSPLNGTSIYAEAQAGERGYVSGMAGIRFRSNEPSRFNSLGQSTLSIATNTGPAKDLGKPLINRDRTDYVLSWLPKDPQKGKYQKNPTVVPAAGGNNPPPGQVCTANGQACTINNAAACCSGICNGNGNGNAGSCGAVQACTPGGGACNVLNPNTCCSGTCNGQTNTCTNVCTPGGGACSVNNPGTCCSQQCNGQTNTCVNACTPGGGACDVLNPAACCSQQCNGQTNTCANVCTPTGGACSINNPGTCCSNTCLNGNTCG